MKAICINLPNPHITIHENIDQCGHHWNVNEERTRELRTPLDGIKLIRDIECKDLRFAAQAELNGLWVYVDRDVREIAEEIQESMNKTYNMIPAFPIKVCG
jgi:hypothetical protein